VARTCAHSRGTRSCAWHDHTKFVDSQSQSYKIIYKVLHGKISPPTAAITFPLSPMGNTKSAKPKGIKKEKLTTNPIKASTTSKVKNAAKKAVMSSAKGSKENIESSATTVQRHTKPSKQNSSNTVISHEASPDIAALKAHIKELEGMSLDKVQHQFRELTNYRGRSSTEKC
jgi:hypothetical protein